MAGTLLTGKAFNEFRTKFPELRQMPLERKENEDQIIQITPAQGLEFLEDGSKSIAVVAAAEAPEISAGMISETKLWVIRSEDVVYAPERCAEAEKLMSKVFKHSNLTGGSSAHSAGELLFLDHDVVVVNGKSGRYGVKSAAEMEAVASAFRRSGYDTWSMGFDDEADRPYAFMGKTPEWVTS